MTDSYIRYLARSPADFWSALAEILVNFTSIGPSDDWGFAIVADIKGPGIEIFKTYSGGDVTYHWQAIWDDATWQTPIAQRPWASTWGTSSELQFGFGFGPPPDMGWSDLWDALGAAILDWMAVALVLDEATIIDARTVLSTDGELQLGSFVIFLDTDGSTPSYVVWAMQPVAFVFEDDEAYRLSGYPYMSPCISPIAIQQQTGSALNRIADSLETISLQDIEVSVNHNAYMWSIRGKVRVG